MQHDILNTEVTTIDGQNNAGGLRGQSTADRERGVKMRPDAAV